jgi:MFS superfamily sulfate permease-like transporter
MYADVGNKMISEQMLNDANKTLQDPLCPKTRATEQMLRSIDYYKSHPGMLTMQSMPAIYRYLSLIVLLVGYLVLYMLYYLYRSYFVYNDFLIGILVVFVLSIALNYVVRNQYMKKAARQ